MGSDPLSSVWAYRGYLSGVRGSGQQAFRQAAVLMLHLCGLGILTAPCICETCTAGPGIYSTKGLTRKLPVVALARTWRGPSSCKVWVPDASLADLFRRDLNPDGANPGDANHNAVVCVNMCVLCWFPLHACQMLFRISFVWGALLLKRTNRLGSDSQFC